MDMDPGYVLEVEGCIKGYHVYRERPNIGEKLSCERDTHNRYDKRAVAVVKPRSGDYVGHVPRGFSRLFSKWLDMINGNDITCIATGRPQVSTKPWPGQLMRGGGAIIPCVYVVKFWQLLEAEEAREDMKLAIHSMGMSEHLGIVTEFWNTTAVRGIPDTLKAIYKDGSTNMDLDIKI